MKPKREWSIASALWAILFLYLVGLVMTVLICFAGARLLISWLK